MSIIGSVLGKRKRGVFDLLASAKLLTMCKCKFLEFANKHYNGSIHDMLNDIRNTLEVVSLEHPEECARVSYCDFLEVVEELSENILTVKMINTTGPEMIDKLNQCCFHHYHATNVSASALARLEELCNITTDLMIEVSQYTKTSVPDKPLFFRCI